MVQCNMNLCIAQNCDTREKGSLLQLVKRSDSGPPVAASLLPASRTLLAADPYNAGATGTYRTLSS